MTAIQYQLPAPTSIVHLLPAGPFVRVHNIENSFLSRFDERQDLALDSIVQLSSKLKTSSDEVIERRQARSRFKRAAQIIKPTNSEDLQSAFDRKFPSNAFHESHTNRALPYNSEQDQVGGWSPMVEHDNEAYPFQQPQRKGYVALHQQHKNKKPVYVTINQQTVNGLLSLLLLFILSICGCMGSILIISALTVIESLQTRGNCYLVSLALGHLLVSLLVIPSSAIQIMAGDSINGSRLCHYQWLVLEFSMIVSQLSFLLMAADNYLGYKSSTKLITGGQIESSHLLGAPELGDLHPSQNGALCAPEQQQTYALTGSKSNSGAAPASGQHHQQRDGLLMSKQWSPSAKVAGKPASVGPSRRFAGLISDLVTWLVSRLVPCSASFKRRRKWKEAAEVQRAKLKLGAIAGQDLELAKLREPGCFSYRNCCGRLRVLLWTLSVWSLAFAYTIHQKELSYGPKFCQILPPPASKSSPATGNGSGTVWPGSSPNAGPIELRTPTQSQSAGISSTNNTITIGGGLQSSLQRPITNNNRQAASRDQLERSPRHAIGLAKSGTAERLTGFGGLSTAPDKSPSLISGLDGVVGSLIDQLIGGENGDHNSYWMEVNPIAGKSEVAKTTNRMIGQHVSASASGLSSGLSQPNKSSIIGSQVGAAASVHAARDLEIGSHGSKLTALGNPDERPITKGFRSAAQPRNHSTGGAFVYHEEEPKDERVEMQPKKRARDWRQRGTRLQAEEAAALEPKLSWTGDRPSSTEFGGPPSKGDAESGVSTASRNGDKEAGELGLVPSSEVSRFNGRLLSVEDSKQDQQVERVAGTFNGPIISLAAARASLQSGWLQRRLHKRKRASNDGPVTAGGGGIKSAQFEWMSGTGEAALEQAANKNKNNGNTVIVKPTGDQRALEASIHVQSDSYHRNKFAARPTLMGGSLNEKGSRLNADNGGNNHNDDAGSDNKLRAWRPAVSGGGQSRGEVSLNLPYESWTQNNAFNHWPVARVTGEPFPSKVRGPVDEIEKVAAYEKLLLHGNSGEEVDDDDDNKQAFKHDGRTYLLQAYDEDQPEWSSIGAGSEPITRFEKHDLRGLQTGLQGTSSCCRPVEGGARQTEVADAGRSPRSASSWWPDEFRSESAGRSIVQDLNDNLMNNNNDGTTDKAEMQIMAGKRLSATSLSGRSRHPTTKRLSDRPERQAPDSPRGGAPNNKAQMANNNVNQKTVSAGNRYSQFGLSAFPTGHADQLMTKSNSTTAGSNSTQSANNNGRLGGPKHYWLMLFGAIVMPSLTSAILFARAYCRMKEFKMRPYKPMPMAALSSTALPSILMAPEQHLAPAVVAPIELMPAPLPSRGAHNQVVAEAQFAGSSYVRASASEHDLAMNSIGPKTNGFDEAAASNTAAWQNGNSQVHEGTREASFSERHAIKNITNNNAHHKFEWPNKAGQHNNGGHLEGAEAHQIDRSISQASAPSSTQLLQGKTILLHPINDCQLSQPQQKPFLRHQLPAAYEIRRQQVNQAMSAPIGFDRFEQYAIQENSRRWAPDNNSSQPAQRAASTVGNPAISAINLNGPASDLTSRLCLFPNATGNTTPTNLRLERDCSSAASYSAPPSASFRRDHYDVFSCIDSPQQHQQQQALRRAPLNELVLTGNDSSTQAAGSELLQHRRISAAASQQQQPHHHQFSRSHNHAQSFHYGSSGRQYVQNANRLGGHSKQSNGAHLQRTADGLALGAQSYYGEPEQAVSSPPPSDSFGMRHLMAARSPQHLSPTASAINSADNSQRMLERHRSLPRSSRLYQSDSGKSHLYDSGGSGGKQIAEEAPLTPVVLSGLELANERPSYQYDQARAYHTRRRQIVDHGQLSMEQAEFAEGSAADEMTPEAIRAAATATVCSNLTTVSMALASVIKSIDGDRQVGSPRSGSSDSQANARSLAGSQATERTKSALESSSHVSTLMKSSKYSGSEASKSPLSSRSPRQQQQQEKQQQQPLVQIDDGVAGKRSREAAGLSGAVSRGVKPRGTNEDPAKSTSKTILCTYSYMTDDQLLKSNIIVFILNLTLWFPFVLLTIAAQYREQFTQELKDSVWWMATLNCCSCSYVYALTNKDFREAFNKLFYYCCCKSHVTFQRKTPIFRRQLDVDSKGNLRVHIIPGLNVFSSKLSNGTGGPGYPHASSQQQHPHGGHHNHHHYHHNHHHNNHHSGQPGGAVNGPSGLTGAHYRQPLSHGFHIGGQQHAAGSSLGEHNSGSGHMAVRHRMPLGFGGGFGCPLFASSSHHHVQSSDGGHSSTANKL